MKQVENSNDKEISYKSLRYVSMSQTSISKLNLQVNPPGTIIYIAGSTPPTGYLKANGATISRSVYSELFSVISTTYGTGDGNTTFQLPDLRGEFIRSWDDGRGVDSGRTFGSFQEATSVANGIDTWQGSGGVTGGGDGSVARNIGSLHARASSQAGTAVTGSQYVRVRNLALLPCIKV